MRDQWRRTPLHYAMGLPDGGAIVAALMDLGSSEHALDMVSELGLSAVTHIPYLIVLSY